MMINAHTSTLCNPFHTNIDILDRWHFPPVLSFIFSFFLPHCMSEPAGLASLQGVHSLIPNAFHFMALHLKVVASVYVPNLSITAFDLMKASSLQPESISFHQYLNKLEPEPF